MGIRTINRDAIEDAFQAAMEISMTRSEILDKAKDIVNGQREQDYGSPEDNFNKIAMLWTVYLGHDVTAKDVVAMMNCLSLREHRRVEVQMIAT